MAKKNQATSSSPATPTPKDNALGFGADPARHEAAIRSERLEFIKQLDADAQQDLLLSLMSESKVDYHAAVENHLPIIQTKLLLRR